MTFKHKNAKHFQYFDYPIGLNKMHTNMLTLRVILLLMSKGSDATILESEMSTIHFLVLTLSYSLYSFLLDKQ